MQVGNLLRSPGKAGIKEERIVQYKKQSVEQRLLGRSLELGARCDSLDRQRWIDDGLREAVQGRVHRQRACAHRQRPAH